MTPAKQKTVASVFIAAGCVAAFFIARYTSDGPRHDTEKTWQTLPTGPTASAPSPQPAGTTPDASRCQLHIDKPAPVVPGGQLRLSWTLEHDGRPIEQVYIAFTSRNPDKTGLRYHYHQVVANRGRHTLDVPEGLDPRGTHTVYVESARNGRRLLGGTPHCYRYQRVTIIKD